MKILVGCERSGVVRRAFRALGHDAWSCDIEPADDGPLHHFCCTIEELLVQPLQWDLGIFFPPCTHLAVSGARYFKQKRADGRQQAAIDFFMRLVNAPIDKIAIENPVGIMSSRYRKPDQIIQPWQFGHPESKATCLWLKGLPRLEGTDVLISTRVRCRACLWRGKRSAMWQGRCPVCRVPSVLQPLWANQTPSGQNKLGPSADRAAIRSKTYDGIGAAMAQQWGGAT